jgi:DNA-binding NtrC family response regulator
MVLLGVHEEDPDGVEMIPLVHQIDRNLPVVVVGDGVSLDMERRVRLEKVFYYMVQPVDFDEMRQVVQRALQGKEE